jgi:glycosyltransferase involved in cell wall biosynthesis
MVKIFTLVEVSMCHTAKFVICVSDEEKARLVRLGVPNEKITVIMSLPEFQNLPTGGELPIDSRQTIIYAGHLLPWKGVNLLLEAFSYLQAEIPETRLVVLGDGPSRKVLERQAQKLSISSNVSFLGWLQPRDAFDLIRASDVAVIPHLVTSMPSKLFTYMHCGKPIVASDFPSVRNVLVEAECGLLFRPADARDLCEALRRILVDKALRSKLAASAERAARQHHNWENECYKLVALYSNLNHDSS